MHPLRIATLCLTLLLTLAVPGPAQTVASETYTLPNGLTVTLHEDHRLPQVVVNLWYGVGSRDEASGRTGFAHLFEHLMFMGTERVPGNQFDVLMETGGGGNNASTSEDRTDYYSLGPSSLLPTLLWLDADRMEGLGRAMTQEKVDLQRDVVRNELRQSYENAPYGRAELAVGEALYPADHPYHHPVIGSHEDLEAATLAEVKSFFATHYVPANASLVVAGDLPSQTVRELVARTFGAVPAGQAPAPRSAPQVRLEREVRRLLTDAVESPKLYLVWPSPPAYGDGDAAMDLLAALLADGSSGRLYRRLVLEEQLAREVAVFQSSMDLGSQLRVEVVAGPGGDLERVKRVVLEEIGRLQREAPGEAELGRVKATVEARFRASTESLEYRALMLNVYRHAFGQADSFQRDLARRLAPSAADIGQWARTVLGEGRLDLRVLPQGEQVAGASLDRRPPDLPSGPVHPPAAESLTLSNGVPLTVVRVPGSGLFSGYVVVDGGERDLRAEQSGLSALAATMLTAGAGGLDAAAFADAVASLGATVEARSSWHDLTLAVRGLSSRLEPTLDLLASVILRANLRQEDFERERRLALEAIAARAEDPYEVASLASQALLYGREDVRGRPTTGYAATVGALTLADLTAALPRLLDPGSAHLVFVGDLDPAALRAALDARLGGWQRSAAGPPALPAPAGRPPAGRVVVVDRPGAPQTIITVLGPLSPADERRRAERDCLDALFGGTFTSRLMQNIREQHGYSYGARSEIVEEGNQLTMIASSAVQATVTGAALAEFKREYDALAGGDVRAEELDKAVRTLRFALAATAETTRGLADTLAGFLGNGRPVDAVARELASLDRVELDSLRAEARSGLFDWSTQLVVLVGDRATILAGLEQAGFPAPLTADVEGRLLPSGG